MSVMLKAYTITVDYHKYLNKSIYNTFLNVQIRPPYAQKTQKPQRIYVPVVSRTMCPQGKQHRLTYPSIAWEGSIINVI